MINGSLVGILVRFYWINVKLCLQRTTWDINTIEPDTNYPNEYQNTNKFDQLQKLSKLKESGAITEEEFENEKENIK